MSVERRADADELREIQVQAGERTDSGLRAEDSSEKSDVGLPEGSAQLCLFRPASLFKLSLPRHPARHLATSACARVSGMRTTHTHTVLRHLTLAPCPAPRASRPSPTYPAPPAHVTCAYLNSVAARAEREDTLTYFPSRSVSTPRDSHRSPLTGRAIKQ